MFERLFKTPLSEEFEQLKTRCTTLENQVGVLEQQLRNLTITLQMSNQEIQSIVRKYRSSLWELKKIANDLPSGHEKVIYERAFYSID